jgi:hypothetical protein
MSLGLTPARDLRRKYSECATLGSRGGPDVHCHLHGSVRIRHSVDVTAESVYEAAALGVSALRESGWADAVALGTELEVQVRDPFAH